MNTNKERFLNRIKNKSLSACFGGIINNNARLSLGIILILICLLLLVGILS